MTYRFKADPHSSHGVMLRWAGPARGRTLLDVGAHTGFLSERFAAQGWKVTRLDREGDQDLLVDLNRELPETVGAFDTIVCGDVLEHLMDPHAVLRWLRGHVLPEGRLLLSVPNVAHLWVRLSLLVGRWPLDDQGILDRTHRHFFTARTVRDLVVSAGWRVVRRTATPAPIRASRLQALLARRWPSLFGYQFVMLVQPGSRRAGREPTR